MTKHSSCHKMYVFSLNKKKYLLFLKIVTAEETENSSCKYGG